MRPTDLALLRTPGVPTVSPDGRIAVVAVSRLDLDGDEYRGQLWAVPTDGSAPARPLTSGARDSAPAFSPPGPRRRAAGFRAGGPRAGLSPRRPRGPAAAARAADLRRRRPDADLLPAG